MSAHDIENEEGTEGPSVIAGACRDLGVRKTGAYIFFGVYAPSADNVWLVGTFNEWRESHPMVRCDDGIWRIRLSRDDIPYGTAYKYKIYVDGEAEYIPDPYAVETDGYPYHNSVYRDTSGKEHDVCSDPIEIGCSEHPLSIYKLKLDSWMSDGYGNAPDYLSLTYELLPYILQMGYTHVAISGMSEKYYDLGKDYMTKAGFVVNSRQGGVDLLCELIRKLRSAGIGIFVELSLENTFGDDAVDLAFHTDNALFWLGVCCAGGILIDSTCKRDKEFLARLVHSIKMKRDGTCIAMFSGCGIKKGIADITVDLPVKYLPLFKDANTFENSIYARAAAMTCLLLGDGRMLTRMGDEFAQGSGIGEVFDTNLQNEALRARFQFFCSELDQIYAASPCFWSGLAHSDVTKRSGGCFSIKRTLNEEEFAVIADISGCGAEIRVGDGEWHLMLDSRRLLGARECAATVSRGGKTALRLPPYGAVVLKKQKRI